MIRNWFFEINQFFLFSPIFSQDYCFVVKNVMKKGKWSGKLESNVGQVVILDLFAEFRIYETLLQNFRF
jgi:hypothetical protein